MKLKSFYINMIVSIFVAYLVISSSSIFASSNIVNISDKAAKPDLALIEERIARFPLSFEQNKGQTSKNIDYLARGNGYILFLTSKESIFKLKSDNRISTVNMILKNANSSVKSSGLSPFSFSSHYITEKQTSYTNIKSFEKVEYKNIYDGIDIVYYGNKQQLEYDFIISPGADPQKIKFDFKGADNVSINAKGELEINVSGVTLRFLAPFSYQIVKEKRQVVASRYIQKEDIVTFELGDYDVTKELIIDPVLVFSTYLGGSGLDRGLGIALDKDGDIYISGQTVSVDFPTTSDSYKPYPNSNPSDITTINNNIYITKISADGSDIIYSTYLGGSGYEYGGNIAITSKGEAVVVGNTASTDFPVINGFRTAEQYVSDLSQPFDAFVAKLSSTGDALIYSSYLGGSREDNGRDIGLDAEDMIYIAGHTYSANIATENAVQTEYRGADVYVAKIDSSKSGISSLLYLTYIGGSSKESTVYLDVDALGHAYVTGYTMSEDFPVSNAFQSTFSGIKDVFLSKLGTTGGQFIYSTYLGGGGDDSPRNIKVDSNENVYIVGATYPTYSLGYHEFPLKNPLSSAYSNILSLSTNGFITQFDSSGQNLLFSTLFGGNNSDFITGIAHDSQGDIVVIGSTTSTDFPLINMMQEYNNNKDAFIIKLTPSSGNVIFSTFFGGNSLDSFYNVIIDSSDDILITGTTGSVDFPLKNPLQYNYGSEGGFNAFIVKIHDNGSSEVTDLELKIVSEPSNLSPDDAAHYLFLLTNKGPDNATNVHVTGELKSNAIDESLTVLSDSEECLVIGNTFDCTIGNLSSLDEVNIEIDFVASVGETQLSVNASGNETDSNILNNTIIHKFETTGLIAGTSDMSVAMMISEYTKLNVLYNRHTLLVNNVGPDNAMNVKLIFRVNLINNTFPLLIENANCSEIPRNVISAIDPSLYLTDTSVIYECTIPLFQVDFPKEIIIDIPANDPEIDYVNVSSLSADYNLENNTLINDGSIQEPPVDNAPPIVSDSFHVIDEGTLLKIKLEAVDAENDAVTFEFVRLPVNGAATISGNGELTYTPKVNFSGSDSIEVLAYDGVNYSSPFTITINITEVVLTPPNTAPILLSKTFEVNENSSLVVFLSASDAEEDALSFELISAATSGTSSVTVNGELTYEPGLDFSGTDLIGVRIFDGKNYSEASTIIINVLDDVSNNTSNPSGTIFAKSPELLIEEENVLVITDLLSYVTTTNEQTLTIGDIVMPEHGVLESISDTSYKYTPEKNYFGNDSFDYIVSSSTDEVIKVVVKIIIQPINDPPVIEMNGINGIVMSLDDVVSINVNASDIESTSDSLLYKVENSLLGTVAFDNNRLTFSAMSQGSEVLEIVVSDEEGLESKAYLPVTVWPASENDLNADNVIDHVAVKYGLDIGSTTSDSDGDGIVDALEIGDPNSPTDSDSDGVIDALEQGANSLTPTRLSFKVSPKIATNLQLNGLSTSSITMSLSSDSIFLANANNKIGLPLYSENDVVIEDAEYNYPLGLFDFSIKTQKKSETVLINFSDDVLLTSDMIVRKLNRDGEWLTLSNASIDIDNHSISFEIIDNDIFDSNPELGVIHDPVGLAVLDSKHDKDSESIFGLGSLNSMLFLIMPFIILFRRKIIFN